MSHLDERCSPCERTDNLSIDRIWRNAADDLESAQAGTAEFTGAWRTYVLASVAMSNINTNDLGIRYAGATAARALTETFETGREEVAQSHGWVPPSVLSNMAPKDWDGYLRAIFANIEPACPPAEEPKDVVCLVAQLQAGQYRYVDLSFR